MYYKLLNKNLITAALVSAIALSTASVCNAQGVVSLVEDEDISLPKADETNEAVTSAADTPVVNEDFNAVQEKTDAEADPLEDTEVDELGANLTLDAELPDTLDEEDVIPLDKNAGLMVPAPTAQATPAEKDENVPDDIEEVVDGETPDDDFSLGVEVVPTTDEIGVAKAVLPTTAESAVTGQGKKSPAETKEDVKAIEPNRFANSILDRVDNDLFTQMSDIEKQTTLLTLELRREKLRNEIEAIKAQRAKAESEKMVAEEEKERKDFEWKKEQEAKVLREQQILKDKEIELEKLKQKKSLNAYMNEMLQQKQKWISDNAKLYDSMTKVEKDRKALVDNFKGKLDKLTVAANKFVQSATSAKSNHDRTVASLTAQNLQMKKRIEADAVAAKNRQQAALANTVATGGADAPLPTGAVATSIDEKIMPINISKEYAIMDITGKGNNLVAKLINKDGESFLARQGTILQTGHTIEEITPTYIQFDRNGLKDYLYALGSAITMEPEKIEGGEKNSKTKRPTITTRKTPSQGALASEAGVPSLGSGMFVK